MKKYFNHFVDTYKNLISELEYEFNKTNSHLDFNAQNQLESENVEIQLNNIVKKLKDKTFAKPNVKLTGHDTFSSFSVIEEDETKSEKIKIDYFHFVVDKILKNGLPYYAFQLDLVYIKKQELNTKLETFVSLNNDNIHICIDSRENSQFLDFGIIFIGENKFYPTYVEYKHDEYILNEEYDNNRKFIKSLYQLAHNHPERVFDFLFKKSFFNSSEKDQFSILYDIAIDLNTQEKYTIDICLS